MLKQRFVPDQALAELVPWPDGNPKDHDVGFITESIDALGFFGAILAQEGTNHVVAGHGRLERLLEAGQTTGPVLFVKCSREVARSILLADNRGPQLGGWNEPALASFLANMLSERNGDVAVLRGTGFDAEDVQRMAEQLAPLQFPTLDNTSKTVDVPHTAAGDLVRVRVGDPSVTEQVVAALQALFAEHPEWSAKVVPQ